MSKVLITGADGFVGRHLCLALSSEGHEIVKFSTRPLLHDVPVAKFPPVDIVINLAGENLSQVPWTAKRKQDFWNSRVILTEKLIAKLAADGVRPRIFLSASAVGFYGDTGAGAATETAASGAGFLADLCKAWESKAERASTVLNSRTVLMRFGVVIGNGGGMMERLLPIFRFCLGGKLGSGNQYLSWISIDDLTRAILFVIKNESISGAVNFVAPRAVTNSELTNTIAKHVSRPAVFKVPAAILQFILGDFAKEILLKSTKAVPQKLSDAGFQFSDSELNQAVGKLS